MGRFLGKKPKGISLSRVKRHVYRKKRSLSSILSPFSPAKSPCSKRFRVSLTPKVKNSPIRISKQNIFSESKRKRLFDSDSLQVVNISPMKCSPQKVYQKKSVAKTPVENSDEESEIDVMNALGCSFFQMPLEIQKDLNESDELQNDAESPEICMNILKEIPNDRNEYNKPTTFKDTVDIQDRGFSDIPIEILNDLEKSEELDLRNGQSPDIAKTLANLIPEVVKELQDNENVECLGIIEDFFRLIREKRFPLTNICFLLWCDMVKWFSLDDTRAMRYSDQCLQFYWVGKRLFGGKFLRFMSGLRNNTMILKGEEAFKPGTSNINFACPKLEVLQNYHPLGSALPDTFKPGLLSEMIRYKAERSDRKDSFVLMLDGKKMKRGADVDLLGCETGESLTERRATKMKHEDIIQKATLQFSDIQNTTNIVNETPKEKKTDVMVTLIGILMLFSSLIKGLRSLRKKKQYALKKLVDLGGKEWKKSKYAFSIDLLKTSLWKIENCIDKILSILKSICKTGAYLNGAGHMFACSDSVDLKCQENVFLLKEVENLAATVDQNDTSVIKQRSEKWFSDRSTMKVTGSTAYQALGCDGLKRQKEHYNKVILGKTPPEPNEFQKTAMKHGTDCEIHQIATLGGVILPFLYPNLKFYEEGYYIRNGMLVSPDGSLRDGERTVTFAFEGKAPMENLYKAALHDEVPVRYITQTILESQVLGTSATIYMCWTDVSCTVYKVPRNEELCDDIFHDIQGTYCKEKTKCPTRTSPNSKEFTEKFKKHSQDCVFLGEFPSVKGVLCQESESEKENVRKHNSTETELSDKSPYKRHKCKPVLDIEYTYDDIQRHLILAKEVVNDAYELQRTIASQVVVYLLGDLDRFWKSEQPHALPVMYFYRGYSLNMEIARKITEKCKEELRDNGLDVVVTAADGEFHHLMVRSHDGRPLTQHQLMKDYWKEICPLSKAQILERFMIGDVCKPGQPVQEFLESRSVWTIQSQSGNLQRIRSPRKGWAPPKRTVKPSLDTEETNESATTDNTNTLIHELEATMENTETMINELETSIENTDTMNDIESTLENTDTVMTDTENINNSSFDDATVDLEIAIGSTERNLSYNEKAEISISRIVEDLNIGEVKNVLVSVNQTKWSDVSLEYVASHLHSAEKLKKLTVKELIELTKYINEQIKEPSDMLKASSNTRKHELINSLSKTIGDGSTTEPNRRTKKAPDTLKQLAQKAIMRKTYPKRALAAAYCNYKWQEVLQKWYEKSGVSSEIRIKGLEEKLNPYYVPDRTRKEDDFEVFVYDKTHLGSNLRKCLCLNKVQGVSIKAWEEVVINHPEILHPLVIEVSEEGKIQDQMREQYARNMFSFAVEEKMRSNWNIIEADFCSIIRGGLYEAEDVPGISATERCLKRMRLIRWLNTDIDFGNFPPHGSKLKGLSSILYEGLRASTEAKLYLYVLAKKGNYSVRAPNTLCSESFFSSMQEMDPWGQGVLSADGIEKHITDFTTLTALKMDENRSFSINTKKGKMYPVPKVDNATEEREDEENGDSCHCRQDKFIQCIVPKDHFFDTKERARGRKVYDKPVKFSGFNEPLRGDQPIRSRYAYKVNEAKVPTSKRLGLRFENERDT